MADGWESYDQNKCLGCHWIGDCFIDVKIFKNTGDDLKTAPFPSPVIKTSHNPGLPRGSSQYRRASEAPRVWVCLLYEPLPPCLGGDRNCKNFEEWDLEGNEQNCQSRWKIAADSCCVFSYLWFVAVSFTHFKIFICLPQVFVSACKLIVVACVI